LSSDAPYYTGGRQLSVDPLGGIEIEVAMANKYILVSGVFFGLISVAQLVRAIAQVPVIAGGIEVPVWASWIAAFVTGALCVWAFRYNKG
jgi:hypothetical protein